MNSAAPPAAGGSGSRRVIAVGIVVVLALLHAVRVGSYLDGSVRALYYSYFSDIALPFGMYFLLCAAQVRHAFLRAHRTRAALAFAPAAAAEVLQAVGVPALGTVFDPLDFVMYGVGVGLALLVDAVVLRRVLPGWSLESQASGPSRPGSATASPTSRP